MEGNCIIHASSAGNIILSAEALGSVVSLTVEESPGIAGLSSGIYDRLKNTLRPEKTRGVHVDVDETGKITITVSVFVYFGEKIAEIVLEMQRAIKENVEGMAQAEVLAVNVNIDGIKFRKEQGKI